METLSREDSEEEVPAAFFEASLFLFEILFDDDILSDAFLLTSALFERFLFNFSSLETFSGLLEILNRRLNFGAFLVLTAASFSAVAIIIMLLLFMLLMSTDVISTSDDDVSDFPTTFRLS